MWYVCTKLSGPLFPRTGFKFTSLLTLMLLSLLLIAAGQSYAATYYIAPNGSDGAAGTSSAPWLTFGHAIPLLNAGDTLWVNNGTYSGTSNLIICQTSGTSENYITVKAINDGQVTVDAEGEGNAINDDGMSYWDVEGIVFRNGSQNVVNLSGNHHIFRRDSAYDGGVGIKAEGEAFVVTGNYNLLEDCVACANLIESYGYLAIDNWGTGNIFRRCFTLGVVVTYEGQSTITENCIAFGWPNNYGAVYGIGNNNTYDGTPRGSNNSFYGDIGISASTVQTSNLIVSMRAAANNTNVLFSNCVGINGSNANLTVQSATSSNYNNNTLVQTGVNSSLSALAEFERWDEICSIGATFNNNALIAGASTQGGLYVTDAYDVADGAGTVSVNSDYNAYVGFGSYQYVGNSVQVGVHDITIAASSNPYNTSTYGLGAYLFTPSSLLTSGSGGGPVGANVLYEYVNGSLTSTPLWPWPMEGRIAAELGVSVTYANDGNGHTGGIWNTLTGVYESTPPPSSSSTSSPTSSTSSADTTPPSVPAGLTATVVSSSHVSLAWTASTDPAVTGQTTSGVAGYDVYRNGSEIATVTTTSYSDSGLSPATTYSYTVDAFDNAGNKSSESVPVTTTTQSIPDGPVSISNVIFADNGGGGQYTDQNGVVYQADTDYSGGATYSTTAAIAGTADSTVYQSQRYGNFSYDIPLADGNYNVTLKFAELYFNAAGQRVFDVGMQGTQVITNMDVYAQVGQNAAYDVTIPVSVTNGTLNIVFTSVVDNAIVNAIEVTPTTYTITATAGTGGSISPSGSTTVNSGGSQTYTITLSSGYSISSVQVDGVSVGAVSSYTFSSVTANHAISATFAVTTYTITAAAGTGGSISPYGATIVNSGSSQTYTIAPSWGYSISDVQADGVSAGAVSSYTFSSVTANHTISATFAATRDWNRYNE